LATFCCEWAGTFGLALIWLHANRPPIAIIQRNGPSPPPIYPAEKARGGEIILRTPLCRAIFIGGLLGAVISGLLLVFAR
jgi:hypothetical protein